MQRTKKITVMTRTKKSRDNRMSKKVKFIIHMMEASACSHNKDLKNWIETKPLHILMASVHPLDRAMFSRRLLDEGIEI